MTIEIQESVVQQNHLTEYDLKLRIAISLFEDKTFTLGQAAQFMGLPQLIFQKELGKRKIPIHYDANDLLEDMAHLENF